MWYWQDKDRKHILHVHPCIQSALHNYFLPLKNLLYTLIVWGDGSRIHKGARRIALLCLTQTKNIAAICHQHSETIHCFVRTLLSAFTIVPRWCFFFPLSLRALSHSASSAETSMEF